MFRHLSALIVIAVSAEFSSSVNGRHLVHHPVMVLPAVDGGRRLTGLDNCDECVAICRHVHYKSLCSRLATLSAVTTPVQLLEVAVRVAAANAAMSEMQLGQALRTPVARDKAMASSLKSCRDSYGSLVDSLKSTRSMLMRGGGSRDDVMTELSAAATFSTDCGDIFDERPELRQPIPGAQRHVRRLVSNCLDMAAGIKLP